jgi:hypothetical protein
MRFPFANDVFVRCNHNVAVKVVIILMSDLPYLFQNGTVAPHLHEYFHSEAKVSIRVLCSIICDILIFSILNEECPNTQQDFLTSA